MKGLFIFIISIFAILIFSCNSVNEKPYVVYSVSQPDEFGYAYVEYLDSNMQKCYIYDDANFYKKGDTIYEN